MTSTISQDLETSFREVRNFTELLCAPLAIEDYGVQPMPEASPPKWHLAHTTWFFETFILKVFLTNYQPFLPLYEHLFNSYYNAVGTIHPRGERGNLSRPLVHEIYSYRKFVDDAISAVIKQNPDPKIIQRLILGLHHEQQHQELILTDLKFNFGKNPLRPIYLQEQKQQPRKTNYPKLRYSDFDGGNFEIGARPDPDDFCFDNETPRHVVYLQPFTLGNRLITNGEYLEFVEDGGYREPSLWLSDGWLERNRQGWEAPEYWREIDGIWFEYTLAGETEIDRARPVTHISYYEADAFARWSASRLPTEFEWEVAAGRDWAQSCQDANLSSSGTFHPREALDANRCLTQVIGDCWEWTASGYSPYPKYRPTPGALGEYNGKFMANQYVLRGGSCATSANHIRRTYRNFFYPKDRWQFSGIRLANDRD